MRNRPARMIVCTCFALLVFTSAVASVAIQEPVKNPSGEAAALKGQVSELRDAFVREVEAAGLKCSIPPPSIDIQDVPSFGRYDRETNAITTPTWVQLSEEEKGLFLRSHPDEAAARQEFELGVHHWVLVHELGHWWQACNGAFNNQNHFETELEANRIAAAYWRKIDPSVVAHQRAVFASIVERRSNPVTAGQDERTYFNANYDKLGPTPAYIWFQARMCLMAIDENANLSLADTLRQTARKQ